MRRKCQQLAEAVIELFDEVNCANPRHPLGRELLVAQWGIEMFEAWVVGQLPRFEGDVADLPLAVEGKEGGAA